MTDSCLACGQSALITALDFGPQPAANLLSSAAGESVRREPLSLRFCDACGHGQQAVFYPPQELFGHYLYQSGTSGTLNSYFRWLAAAWSAALPPEAEVLDIASNDGAFLDALVPLHPGAQGVEPATNLVALSRAKGLRVTEGFWPHTPVAGPFDGIIAMNVVAHTPDPLAFMTGVHRALKPSGVALIQTSQVDMFRNAEFDTLYHEHFSFFCPHSMQALARRAGFVSARFLKTNVHGGSLLAILGDDADAVERTARALAVPPFHLGPLSASDRPSRQEAEEFGKNAERTCATVRAIGQLATEAGRAVVLVGVAAKAVTVLQAANLRIDRVVDEAPLKIGRYLPGTALMIEPLEAVRDITAPCLFVLGAWNFAAELTNKVRKYRTQPDQYCVYFPTVSVAQS